MILGFSTQLNGKPTHFVEKIWKGLKENLSKELHAQHEAQMTQEELTKPYQVDSESYAKVKAKLHTIREDKKDRWKTGTNIDFYIDVRKKNMLRFAPVLPVVSTQQIIIKHDTVKTGVWSLDSTIYIDGKIVLDPAIYLKIAHYDGFDSIPDFFNYFNKDFKGKIIHWTDLKY